MSNDNDHDISIALLEERYRNISDAMAKIAARLENVATKNDLEKLVTHAQFSGLEQKVETQGKQIETLRGELKQEGLSNLGQRVKDWALIVGAIAGAVAGFSALMGWIKP